MCIPRNTIWSLEQSSYGAVVLVQGSELAGVKASLNMISLRSDAKELIDLG